MLLWIPARRTALCRTPSAGLVEPKTGVLIGNWFALPGQLFLAVIQMIVVPLVIVSVIRGLAASENLEQLKQLGLVVTSFFVVTTAIAAFIGLHDGGASVNVAKDVVAAKLMNGWITAGSIAQSDSSRPETSSPVDEGPIDEGPIDEGPIDEGPAEERPTGEMTSQKTDS